MAKNQNFDYMLSPQEEHALVLAYSLEALQKLATMHVGNTPLPKEELFEILNAKKVVDGIINFQNEQQLKKDWKDVDWSHNPEFLASLVVSSGIKEIISSCPLKWESLRNTEKFSKNHHDITRREPLWLVEKMVQTTPDFTPHLGTSRKASDAPFRIAKAFWDSLLTSKKLEGRTPLNNRHFSDPKTLSLFQLAVLYKNDKLTKRFPLSQAITSKDDAELTLLCVTANKDHYMNFDEKLQLRIIGRCLKFSPDLSRLIKTKTLVETMEERAKALSSDEQKKLNYDFFDIKYLSYIESQEKKNINFTLGDYVFDYLIASNPIKNAPLADVFVGHIKTLSKTQQEEFVEKVIARFEEFPFINPQFAGLVLAQLDKSVVVDLFKKSFAQLNEDEDNNFVKSFLMAKACFDKTTLFECGKIYLPHHSPLKEGEELFYEHCEDDDENDDFLHSDIRLPLEKFELLFDKSCRPQAKQLADLLTTPANEKTQIQAQLWLEDMRKDKKPRPSRPAHKM